MQFLYIPELIHLSLNPVAQQRGGGGGGGVTLN